VAADQVFASGFLGNIKSLAASDLKSVKSGTGRWAAPVTCVADNTHHFIPGPPSARGHLGAAESSPDVPKTVNKRPTGEIFFTVLRQPDEQPLKTPFLP
jgi:hypothetical protein